MEDEQTFGSQDRGGTMSIAAMQDQMHRAAYERHEEQRRKARAASARARQAKKAAGLVRVGCEIHESNRAFAAHLLREIQVRLKEPEVRGLSKADVAGLFEGWNAASDQDGTNAART